MVRASRRGREPTQRQLRVGESLRHALAELLVRRELRDPALADQSITVTEVRVSPDMRRATAYVLPLGGAEADDVLAGLHRAAPHLSARLAEMVRLKNTPRLSFLADASFEQAQRIDRVLRRPEVARDLAPAEPARDDRGDDR
jgi:ribosome-binding factor A